MDSYLSCFVLRIRWGNSVHKVGRVTASIGWSNSVYSVVMVEFYIDPLHNNITLISSGFGQTNRS